VAKFDSERVVSSCLNHEIRVWGVAEETCLAVLNLTQGLGSTLHFKESLVVCGLFSGEIQVWNYETNDVAVLKGHQDWITCTQLVDVELLGERLPLVVSGSRDGTIRLWEPESGECLRVLSGHNSPIGALQVLFCNDDEQTLRPHELVSGAVKLWIQKHRLPIVLSLSLDGVLCSWCLTSGKLLDSYRSERTNQLALLGFTSSNYVSIHAKYCQSLL
jgi:WD40 repeat protein